MRRFVREYLFHVHSILLHNDGFAVDYLAVWFLSWHIPLHCLAQRSCLPPKIDPNPQANNGDDGKNHHRKHESQKQQDRTSKKAKKVFKHVGFSEFGYQRRLLTWPAPDLAECQSKHCRVIKHGQHEIGSKLVDQRYEGFDQLPGKF